MVERAFAIASKPGYWIMLILGFVFVFALVGVSVHLFSDDAYYPPNLVSIALNLILLVILVFVFFDPILTTFAVITVVVGISVAAMS